MYNLNEGKRSDRGRGMHKSANVLLLYYRVRKGLSKVLLSTKSFIPNESVNPSSEVYTYYY